MIIAASAGMFQRSSCGVSRRRKLFGASIVPEMETFAPGDWVVHRRHGAGQIESCEEIVVDDTKNSYCKIRTPSVTVWLPVEKMNDEWLRPVAAENDFRRALKVLRSPPQPMADTLNGRKGRIRSVDTSDAPEEIAELLRDLWALKKEKKTLSSIFSSSRSFLNCIYLSSLLSALLCFLSTMLSAFTSRSG